MNYVPSTGACCYADPDFGSIALAGNPLTVYGLPFSFGGGYFQTANLTSSGLQYTLPTGYTGGPNNTTGALVISDGTLLYTSDGQVWNPATQSQLGTFPIQIGNVPSSEIGLALDTTAGEIYSVGQQIIGDSIGVVLTAYSTKSYAVTGSLAFPQFYWPTENHLVRWGTNGLAFIAPGVGLTDQEVYILTSSIVSQQTVNPTPTLASISPASIYAGEPAFTLSVTGSGFLSSSVIEWNDTPLATTYINAQQLTASIPAADIADPGSAQIAVFNAAPGGGTSSTSDLTIAAPLSTTTILSIVPGGGTLTAGTPYTLTAAVSATGETATPTGNVVFAIGSSTQTVVLSSSGKATFAGMAPATAGSLTISATYQGAPGFQTSASNNLNETVALANNAMPVMTSLSPAFTAAGGSAFTLTVSGSGFVSGSTAYWGSTALVTQFVSATQLSAQVTAAEIAASGITNITVDTPGGGTSNSLQFEIDSASSGQGPSFTTATTGVAPGSTATYPVTLPSSASDVSVTCLNLPSGATCTYSAASSEVTIATSATTPAGTYQITVVFTETLPGAAPALIFLPILLSPFLLVRKKRLARSTLFIVAGCLALTLTLVSGCGGGSSGNGGTQPQTHQVTSSGVVTLTVQ